jgi:acyl-CoA thioester hydrolase
VYWEDTDAGGIVFYANYLKFFERARTEWLRHLGVSQHDLRERTGGMFVVSGTELRYHRPARLDDSLCITAALAESGRASLVIDQQAWLRRREPPYCARVAFASAGSTRCAFAPNAYRLRCCRPCRPRPHPLLETLVHTRKPA